MAGDWIKMRTDLAEDPAVIAIACALGMDEDTVVGKLHRLWSWADAQTKTGSADSVTFEWIDRKVRAEGFAKAMESARWLERTDAGICIPKFTVHNGKSAKKRALSARRAAKSRSRKSNASSATKSAPREEERRGEGEKSNPRSHANGSGGGAGGGFAPNSLKKLSDQSLESLADLCAVHRALVNGDRDLVPDGEHGLLAVIAASVRSMRKPKGKRAKYFRGIVRNRGLFDIDGQEIRDAEPRLSEYKAAITAHRASGRDVLEKYTPLCDTQGPA